MHKPIHLIYQGGSGGQLCSHLVLQSQQHFCAFDQQPIHTAEQFDQQFERIKQQQWHDIPSMDQWKTVEHWPQNNLTQSLRMPDRARFFLTVNPSINDTKKYRAIKVLIYTDLATQLELSQLKRAWIYHPNYNVPVTDDATWQTQYCGDTVSLEIPQLAQQCTVVCKLQDVVKTQAQILCEQLSLPWNDMHKQLVTHWLSLHPESVRQKLLQ
jgi:hypothetical protein